MERYRKLAYDVSVNVVANLIAAAIIYLVGALAGLFPSNPFLLIITMMLLGVAALTALSVVVEIRWRRSRVRRYVYPSVLAVMTVTLIVTAVGGTGDTSLRVLLAVAALACLGATVVMAVTFRTSQDTQNSRR